mgnify:CR=1 FL=1
MGGLSSQPLAPQQQLILLVTCAMPVPVKSLRDVFDVYPGLVQFSPVATTTSTISGPEIVDGESSSGGTASGAQDDVRSCGEDNTVMAARVVVRFSTDTAARQVQADLHRTYVNPQSNDSILMTVLLFHTEADLRASLEPSQEHVKSVPYDATSGTVDSAQLQNVQLLDAVDNLSALTVSGENSSRTKGTEADNLSGGEREGSASVDSVHVDGMVESSGPQGVSESEVALAVKRQGEVGRQMRRGGGGGGASQEESQDGLDDPARESRDGDIDPPSPSRGELYSQSSHQQQQQPSFQPYLQQHMYQQPMMAMAAVGSGGHAQYPVHEQFTNTPVYMYPGMPQHMGVMGMNMQPHQQPHQQQQQQQYHFARQHQQYPQQYQQYHSAAQFQQPQFQQPQFQQPQFQQHQQPRPLQRKTASQRRRQRSSQSY